MAGFSLLSGLFSYLYQLSMGILLTPAQYGILFSLTSLLAIVVIACRTIQVTLAKFTSNLKMEGSWGKINYLWALSLKQAFILGLAAFILAVLLTPLISQALNIDNYLFPIILFSSLIFTFVIPVNHGVLQGLQRFSFLGLSNTLLQLFRFAIGAILVYTGFKVFGALLAFLLSKIIIFLVSIYFLKDICKVGSDKFKVSNISSYASLALLAFFAFALLTNADVLLAKHYLSPENAGNYSAISVLGRIALYAPMGVTAAMFPKTAELSELGSSSGSILKKAVLLSVLLGGVVVMAYWFFPGPIIDFLFRDKYSMVAPHVFQYGLAMLIFSICFLMFNFFLSLNRTSVAYFLLGAALVQILLISLFHNDISQIVSMVLISGGLCLALMLVFYLAMNKGRQSMTASTA